MIIKSFMSMTSFSCIYSLYLVNVVKKTQNFDCLVVCVVLSSSCYLRSDCFKRECKRVREAKKKFIKDVIVGMCNIIF